MKNSYIIGVLFLGVFLTSCFGPGTPTPTPTDPRDRHRDDRRVDRDDRYYDERRDRDEDRREVLDRSRDRYKGRACEDEDRDHDCKEQCRDIYSRRGDREDCEELSVSQIESIHELHELLEDPDDDDLAEVDIDDFDVYLNVSIAPLDKLIGKYSRREAKEFMLWLMEDDRAANVFEKEDDDDDAFEALLEGFSGSFTGDTVYEPFIEKIDGDKLMELAIETGNDETIDWFMDYINEKNTQCEDDEVHANCFKIYCKIGNKIDDEYRDDWLRNENFEEYIEDIIEEGINKSGTHERVHYWGDNNTGNRYEDVGDIDDWVDDLCKKGGSNLTTVE